MPPFASGRPGNPLVTNLHEVGGCQNYDSFLDPYYNTAPNIWGTQEGLIILTTTQFQSQGLRVLWIQEI